MSAVGDFIQNTVGSIVDAAPVILPVAAAVFAPELALAMGVESAAGAAAVGAGLGAVSSAVTGGDPITGAITGGLGGYLGYTPVPSEAAVAQMASELQTGVDNGWWSFQDADKALANFQVGTPVGSTGSMLSNIATKAENFGNSAIKTLASAFTPATAQAAGSAAGGLLSSSNLIGGGLNLLGSYLNTNAAKDAATTQALATVDAARIAADAAKFRPVGVTTRFGSSNFGYDANGNVNTAGYRLSPELLNQQNTLMGLSGMGLAQYAGAIPATLPMGTAADRMMTLGNEYLATTPQAQAAKFMQEQQALVAPTRERELAQLQAQLQAQGRMGLATGGTSTGLAPANPELETFFNAKRMQDLQLAAQATQGGQQYAQFGGALTGLGGDMLKSMYGTQTAAFAPYQTALGGATALEALGQQPMDIGVNIGAKGTASSAQAGMLLGQGMQQAANITGQQAMQAGSPWGNLLQGGANMLQNYGQPQAVYNPGTGRMEIPTRIA